MLAALHTVVELEWALVQLQELLALVVALGLLRGAHLALESFVQRYHSVFLDQGCRQMEAG